MDESEVVYHLLLTLLKLFEALGNGLGNSWCREAYTEICQKWSLILKWKIKNQNVGAVKTALHGQRRGQAATKHYNPGVNNFKQPYMSQLWKKGTQESRLSIEGSGIWERNYLRRYIQYSVYDVYSWQHVILSERW